MTGQTEDNQVDAVPAQGRGGAIVSALDGEFCSASGTEISDEDEWYEERPWPYDGPEGQARLTGNLGIGPPDERTWRRGPDGRWPDGTCARMPRPAKRVVRLLRSRLRCAEAGQ